MSDAYLLAGVRTPIGKFLGGLRSVSATDLGAVVVREAVSRAGLSADEVDEVILGNVVSAGLGQAPARQAALNGGLPPQVAALTINKVCGSGLKAVMLASQAVRLGDARAIVAGGMENMSLAPHLDRTARTGQRLGSVELEDALLTDGLNCAFEACHMGQHAEYTARTFSLTREQLDQFALESHRRAVRAQQEGLFDDEIVPVPSVTRRGEEHSFSIDEGPRPQTNLESLAALKPVFAADGIVTAGNSPMLSDGAAALVVANRQMADRGSAAIKARIVAAHTSGTEPRDLFVAPVTAIRGVLKKAGMTFDDIDLVELNEAFAAQMLACMQELELDPDKVNVHGGGIALGHPIGASGARVLVTLLSALKQRGLRTGLASLCLGGGNAVAMIVERE